MKTEWPMRITDQILLDIRKNMEWCENQIEFPQIDFQEHPEEKILLEYLSSNYRYIVESFDPKYTDTKMEDLLLTQIHHFKQQIELMHKNSEIAIDRALLTAREILIKKYQNYCERLHSDE